MRFILAMIMLVAAAMPSSGEGVQKGAPAPKQDFQTPFQQLQQQQPPAPIIVPAPNVTVQAPPAPPAPPQSEFFQWIFSAIAGLFTAIFGVKTFGEWRKPDLDSLWQNKELRAQIDEMILRAIGTGAPGRLVSQVPVLGAAEPVIRRLVEDLLEARIAELRGGGIAGTGKGQG